MMRIVYEKQTRRFLLSTPHTMVIMELVKDVFLSHVYWGKCKNITVADAS